MMVTTFLLYFILRHVSGTLYGPRLLISPVGGSVTITCYYLATTVNRHDRKYWCKESKFPYKPCQTIISTNHFILQGYEGKVSMKDDPQKGILKVTMTQVEKQDSSNYRCGIGKTDGNLYAGVNLTVWEGPNPPKSPEIIWGKLRGSVMIQCPLETTTLSMRDSLCKISRYGCIPKVDKGRSGRINVTMEDSSGMLNVSINGLRTQDSGMYRCGPRSLNDTARIIQLQVIHESVFSNIVSKINATYEPRAMYTPSQEHDEKSANEVSKERSSQTEQNLLAIVIPIIVILLVLAGIAITVLIKIKQWRKNDSYDVPVKDPEGQMPLNNLKSSEEQSKEQNRTSVIEKESAVGSDNVDTPVTTVYCLVSKAPGSEDCEG
ncbi:polymeric immunoglobulin receptor [Pogona vitticeps]